MLRMFPLSFRLSVIVLGCVTLLSTTHADISQEERVPVTQEQAQILLQSITQGLQNWLGVDDIQWQGESTIHVETDHYRMMFPSLSVSLSDEHTVMINPITVIVVPLTNGRYRVERVDTLMPRIFSPTEKSFVKIGDLQLQGLWDPTLNGFSHLDTVFDSLVLQDERTFLTIDQISAQTNLTQKETNRWDITTHFTLADFFLRGPNQFITIERLMLSSEEEGLDVVRLFALDQTISDFLQREHNELPDEQFYEQFHDLLRGFSTLLEITNFRLASTRAHDKDVQIETMSIELSGDDFEHATSTLSLSYQHDGLVLTPMLIPDLLPRHVTLELEAVDLPHTALWRQFETLITTLSSTINLWKIMEELNVFRDAITNILQTQNSHALLKTFEVITPILNVTGSGKGMMSSTSQSGVTATADFQIHDIESTIQALQANTDRDSLMVILILRVLQGLGEADDSEGHPIHHYRVEFTSTGRWLINDLDFSLLSEMLR